MSMKKKTFMDKLGITYLTNIFHSLFVHTSGDENITGTKTFTEHYYTSIHGESYISGLYLQNYHDDQTSTPTSNNNNFLGNYYEIVAKDKNNLVSGGLQIANRVSNINDIRIFCHKKGESTNNTATVVLSIGYDANSIPYATTISTPLPSDRDGSGDIVTRDFIPKDTRIVHTTNNETIGGSKTFNNTMFINMNTSDGNKDAIFVIDKSLDISTTPTDTRAHGLICLRDKNDRYTGTVQCETRTDGYVRTYLTARRYLNNAYSTANIGVVQENDGTQYAYCPTPPSTSDSSTKIATTAWVNTANCVVHKTGNEEIAGTKYFTSGWLDAKNSNMNINSNPSSSLYQGLAFCDANNVGVARILHYHNGNGGNRGFTMYISSKSTTSAYRNIIGGSLSPSDNNYVVTLGDTGCTGFYPNVAGITLGKNATANRWGQIYSSSTSISTSDERMKTQISEVPNDVLAPTCHRS